jgi:hypothetical protein
LRHQLSMIAVTFLVLATAATGATLVVPGANTAVEGATNNGLPFNIGLFNFSTIRYQQVYDSSEFPSGTILITGMRFRPDSIVGDAFAAVLPDVDIYLSTTSASAGALSSIFADNLGADNTMVLTGTIALSSAATGAGPRDFDIEFLFTTPFSYNPANGNLLLDVFNFGGGTTTQFDAISTSAVTARVFSSAADGVNDAEGGAPSRLGLITQFIYERASDEPVPEPSTYLMMAGGLAAISLLRRRNS